MVVGCHMSRVGDRRAAVLSPQETGMKQGNLDSEVVYSGVRWSMTGQVATEVIRFGVSITLARLPAPNIKILN